MSWYPGLSYSMHQVPWTSPESCDRSVLPDHGYRSSWLPRSVLCDNIIEDIQTNVSSSLRRNLSKDTTKVVNQWVLCPHPYSELISFPGWMTQLQLYHQDPPSAVWGMAQENQSLGVLCTASRQPRCSEPPLGHRAPPRASQQPLLECLREGRDLGNLVQFRDFLKLLNCLLCLP